MRKRLWLCALLAFPPIAANANNVGSLLSDSSATCPSVGQSMITLQEGINAASLAAIKSGSLAAGLAGTNPRKNPSYRKIEENAVAVDEGRAKGFEGLGPLLSAHFDDASVAVATKAVTDEAKADLELVGIYSSLVVQYERMQNHSNKRINPWVFVGAAALSPALAAGMAGGASGKSASSSTTTTTTNGSASGTVVGDQVYATAHSTSVSETTTYEPSAASVAREIAKAEADAQTNAQLERIILVYRPRIETAIYTFNPLIHAWVESCKAAKYQPK